MRAYSMDLRERALLDSDAGMKAADVAAKYRVSGSWVRLLKQRRRETGEVAPRVQRCAARCQRATTGANGGQSARWRGSAISRSRHGARRATLDAPRSLLTPPCGHLPKLRDALQRELKIRKNTPTTKAAPGLLHRRPDRPRVLTPGQYFRLLLVGYFEGLDSERAIAWRAADSFALREFLGLVLPDAPPHCAASCAATRETRIRRF